MWNCVGAVTMGLAKTNNPKESWHRGFESQISATHQTVWKILGVIQREHALGLRNISQESHRLHTKKNTKIYLLFHMMHSK